jgi:hypothetical protein
MSSKCGFTPLAAVYVHLFQLQTSYTEHDHYFALVHHPRFYFLPPPNTRVGPSGRTK